ncbi:hypothetical protein K2Y00_03555 [Patescibacteria group bacterium]|nr:hypothetical protein [Patescibacteria group bacterium]
MKEFLTRRNILIALVIIAGGVAYYLSQVPPPNTIILREDGWHPESLVVEPDTTVIFVNKTSHSFWPASNSHPQHERYPEFDAGRPMAPGESWSFTFTRPGKWVFHDHLRSSYVGSIAVGQEYADYDCLTDIADASVSEKRVCWGEKLYEELRENGAAAAFRLFANFYESDPDFTKVGCHVIAHQLGDNAYGEYLRQGKKLSVLEFPPESVYCGYGYYHGIFEHLIRDNPDFEMANAFCQDLVATYEDTVPRIRLNCYHAIGHGFVPEPSDVEQWGDVQKMTEPAIAACARLPVYDERSECFQGTFNVIGDWMWNNQFGLRFSESDPLSVCRLYEGEISEACYYEVAMRLLPYGDDDLSRIYNLYVAQIENDQIAGMVINSAAAGVIGTNITDDNFIPFLHTCRTLPARVQEDCLKGLTGGFVAHGEPENEYIKAIDFCSDEELTPDEKDICYWNITRTFKDSYSKEKVEQVCTGVEVEYQHYCSYES